MLYYSIAHYYDVNDKRKEAKYKHILKHINAFLKIKDNKKFIIVSTIDAPIGSKRYLKVKTKLNNFCKKY